MGENIIRFKTKWELETPENKRSINVLIPTKWPSNTTKRSASADKKQCKEKSSDNRCN